MSNTDHGTALFRLWVNAREQGAGTFGGFVNRGFYTNLVAKAINDGVLKASKQESQCKGCGRPERFLEAAANPVLMQFNSIRGANAEKIVAMAKAYNTVLFVVPTDTGFDVRAKKGRVNFRIEPGCVFAKTIAELQAWAAKQQR